MKVHYILSHSEQNKTILRQRHSVCVCLAWQRMHDKKQRTDVHYRIKGLDGRGQSFEKCGGSIDRSFFTQASTLTTRRRVQESARAHTNTQAR